MEISVIIPVLHEGKKINQTLDSVKSASADVAYEVIVVDGDSSGDTIEKIMDAEVIKITARQGRASQMNAGAVRACGDILLFLHADTLLPPKAFPKIVAALSDNCLIGGAFDLKTKNRRWIFRAIGLAASFKHRLTRVPYGDQAIFILRSYFKNIGGYAPIPLMEDVELMRRVKRLGGRISILPEAVTTSSRKWENDGVIYTIMRNWLIQTLYLAGVPAERLVRYYYKVK
ncbi:MAG: glycosyl transferase [Deltaproteobacteria bacterium HGW-Deltaproteobacteria-13]|jgi:rSAM/selenodomain-associated transferase 2|nr:MAG: glycosyl transferase [Deltaproteobacteria bacterium HGW-Deltaproteobacteria-13]